MDFKTYDIPSASSSLSTITIVNGGGGGGNITNTGFLDLILNNNKIDNGIELDYTTNYGTLGGINSNTAIYLLSTTSGNTSGWIFNNSDIVSGISSNVAAIDTLGNFYGSSISLKNGTNTVPISVDSSGNLCVTGNLYATGNVSAYGVGTSGTSSGGLISTVYNYSNLNGTFLDSNYTDTFNAFTINEINTKITNLSSTTAKIISDKNFVFSQSLPSATWTIIHNLGKYPAVTVIDSANTVVEGAIVYTDINNIIISFSAPFSGTAIIN